MDRSFRLLHARMVLGLLALVTVSTALAAEPQPAEVLFRNVRVFDGTSGAVTGPTAVLVRGNLIAAIGAGAVPATTAVTIIEGAGRTLMPGLIDNHVHIFMSASSQAEMLDPKSTFAELEAKAAGEARLMLLRGFTSARDMGGPVFGIKRAIDQGKNIGPRIYPSGAMISQTSGHGDFRMPEDRSRRFGGQMTPSPMAGTRY
jgi:imidazolonepropionase-like amidohydrolase